jgi:hypothetical protein
VDECAVGTVVTPLHRFFLFLFVFFVLVVLVLLQAIVVHAAGVDQFQTFVPPGKKEHGEEQENGAQQRKEHWVRT